MASASAPAAAPRRSAPRRATILARIAREARGNRQFLTMTAISAAIALLGLLQSSPAVVIGAMLVSPLMAPIIGLGFGIAVFDSRLLRRSATTLAWGVALAVALCTLISLLSPVQVVTAEIAGRTRPNLFDLGIAVVGGLAGAYATIKEKPTIMIGVAIATALMPPLAVVGFGIATWSWPIASGALFLFSTNVMAITITAAVTARLSRFGLDLSPQQTALQSVVIVGALAVFAVPLGISLARIGQETAATRAVRATITELAGADARIDALDIDYSTDPVTVRATVFAPTYRGDLSARANPLIASDVEHRVTVTIDQLRTLSEANQAAQDRISSALSENETRSAQARSLAGTISTTLDIPLDAVAVDPLLRIAIARVGIDPALAMPRAVAIAALERRFANWKITVVEGAVVAPAAAPQAVESPPAGNQSDVTPTPPVTLRTRHGG